MTTPPREKEIQDLKDEIDSNVLPPKIKEVLKTYIDNNARIKPPLVERIKSFFSGLF